MHESAAESAATCARCASIILFAELATPMSVRHVAVIATTTNSTAEPSL